MDVEKLIEAAEWCAKSEGCEGCCAYGRLGNNAIEPYCCRDPYHAKRLIAIRDHYEAELKEMAEIYRMKANSNELVMLLRCDIETLQKSLQNHKKVIEDYKVRLTAEKAAVIAEVREWADQAANGMVSSNLSSDWDNGFHRCYSMLKSKLFDMSRD